MDPDPEGPGYVSFRVRFVSEFKPSMASCPKCSSSLTYSTRMSSMYNKALSCFFAVLPEAQVQVFGA